MKVGGGGGGLGMKDSIGSSLNSSFQKRVRNFTKSISWPHFKEDFCQLLRAGEGGGGGGRVEFVWTNNMLTKLVKDSVLFNLELTSNFGMT